MQSYLHISHPSLSLVRQGTPTPFPPPLIVRYSRWPEPHARGGIRLGRTHHPPKSMLSNTPTPVLLFVEMYWESKWASEASGITSFSKVGKRANNLHCLIDKSNIEGKKRENNREGKEGETQY